MTAKTLRKALIGAALVLLASTPLFAQVTDSGSITLQGTVPALAQITVTPIAGFDSLDLTTSQSNLGVATVNEKSNVTTGYTVTLTSANNGSFVGLDSGNGDTLAYSISYGGSTVTLTSGSATVTTASARTGAAGVDKTLAISYTGAFLNADTYQDTITLTISAP